MAESAGRRRRPPIACVLCRKRKIRCNRETPCSNCMRARNAICVYDDLSRTGHPQRRGQSPVAVATSPTPNSLISTSGDGNSSASGASAASSHPSRASWATGTDVVTLAQQMAAADIEALKIEIRQLKEKLSNSTFKPARMPFGAPDLQIETRSSRMGGTFHIHGDSRLIGQPQLIPRNLTHKTRLFGQSHCMNPFVLFLDAAEIRELEPRLREDVSKFFSKIQKCKGLARIIKSRRAPAWPCIPTADLPPRRVSDHLVDCYLRTVEPVYRILHVPTFKTDYEALWISSGQFDMSFLVQLKLVLAIGAITYDGQFSLRASAVRWIYEGQTWLSEPKFKSQLGIRSLQTQILLLIAREGVNIGGDMIWISAGTLIRQAVYMGLHRDPAHLPPMPILAAEMRRRLWNTILELALHSSLAAGGPTFISLEEFDAEPPGNFEDDQLVDDDPKPEAAVGLTQMSVAIALRATFPARLAVVKCLNDLSSPGSHEERLRIDSQLRLAYKSLSQALQTSSSIRGTISPSFEMRAVDFIMHRYLSAIHVPLFGLALNEATFAYSRKMVVENSLKLWRTAFPSLSSITSRPLPQTRGPGRDDFARLTVCGSGFCRTAVVQAAFLIAVELRTQLREDEGLTRAPIRPDLLAVLEEAKICFWECIEVGETNIRTYLLISIVTAQVDGLIQGLGKHEMQELLLRTVENVAEKCLPILERMAAQGQPDKKDDELRPSMTLQSRDEWGFLITDDLFNLSSTDPISWLFNGDTT
ncbi:hypothetical protein V8C35DRAFT_302313 [Trichoderma chlorosporum]